MNLVINHLTIKSTEQYLFKDVCIDVKPGEVVTLMGPSGCGKSTLLSVIAGHLSPFFSISGSITLNNIEVLNLAPDQRRIGILFQDDLLFPHLNIWENLAFALPKKITGAQRKKESLATLERIGLAELADKMPAHISGGQRARISLMRMLLSKPCAVLLDEPFSKLDKVLREEFREFVFNQIKKQNVPALMVTHDDADIPAGCCALHWPWH
jgi:putative thiamine transport system ATP-binding protein